MDFNFTEEQEMWRETVRKFTQKELAPTARERAQKNEGYSRELLKKLMDQALPNTRESAMAKWYSPVVAIDAIHNAMLIHGHVGYSEELYLEQRLRDAIGCEFGDGTAEIMKLIIIRELLGRDFLPY